MFKINITKLYRPSILTVCPIINLPTLKFLRKILEKSRNETEAARSVGTNSNYYALPLYYDFDKL